MSDKKSLLAREQAMLDLAIAEFNLKKTVVERLPDGIPMPSMLFKSGYCAAATVRFSEGSAFQSLIAALPAIPCVFISGDTVSIKPVESLRDSDRGQRRAIYPVFAISTARKSEPDTTRWWTKLGDLTVEVNVNGAGLADIRAVLGDENVRFEPNSYSYSTGSTAFLQSRLKRAEDLVVTEPTSPEEAQQCLIRAEAWIKQFFETQGNPFPVRLNLFGADRNLPLMNTEILRYRLRKETGLAGSINWVCDNGYGKIEVGYTVGKSKAHIRVNCEFLRDAPAIDWEALAEYY